LNCPTVIITSEKLFVVLKVKTLLEGDWAEIAREGFNLSSLQGKPPHKGSHKARRVISRQCKR